MRLRSWLVRLNRIAACVGVGALFAPLAHAAPAPAADAAGLTACADAGGVLIRMEGDQVFVSEGARPFERLDLKAGAEADELRRLVQEMGGEAGAARADIGRTTVADGAAGWHHP